MDKIYIIGNSGSGKSYLANKLSNKFNLSHFDLDDVFWEKKYTKKRDETQKQKLLSKIIKENNKWIIEGIFTSFVDEGIKKADTVIWLDININILTYRILKRDLLRVIKGKNSLKNTLGLVKFARSYKKENGYYFKIKDLLDKYKIEYILIKNKKEFNKYLESI